jgi:hypothetical protein
MNGREQALVEKLIARQHRMGVNDGPFAEMLGVSRTTWVQTRNRRIPLRYVVAEGAINAFPDMIPDVLIFLFPRVSLETIMAAIATRLAEKQSNRSD